MAWYSRVPGFGRASLGRELMSSILVALLAAATVFLFASYWLGLRAVRAEHQAAAARVAQLFEASLKNAMLNRDLSGMQSILEELGAMPGVERARVLATDGEVRFGARGEHDRRTWPDLIVGLCLQAGCRVSPPRYTWGRLDGRDPAAGDAGQRMRIAYPIRNDRPCEGCHGDSAARPVNGVLVVDFSSPVGQGEVRRHLWPLAATGVFGLATFTAVIAWVLRRRVMQPVRRLHGTVAALSRGDLSARAAMGEGNEFAQLGDQLDRMAEHTGELLRRLERQRTYLQQLIDAAPDPLVVIDDEFRIVEANARYRELVGADDPIGGRCHLFSRGLDAPCPATMLSCPVVELRQDAAPMRCVMQFRRADGTPVDVEIDAASLVTQDGRRLVVEVVRRLDERLKFSQEQRLSSIGLLANGVAHEIHNPLASIRIALQAALRRMRADEMSAAEFASYLELVDREIDRCVSITQRLMRMSQPAGDALQSVRVATAVDDTVALLREEALRGKVLFEVDIQPSSACVEADEGEFRMMVLNLAQNALHAMVAGGRLSIRGRETDEGYLLEFEDTGIGIAADQLQSIFLPFFSRRADGRRGTGLGLAITRGNVERWGGRIDVGSRVGVGSVFRVRLRPCHWNRR